MHNLPSEQILAHYAPIKHIALCPPVKAHCATDVFLLWQAWEEETHTEQPIPFWAIAWPGAVSMARYLLANSHCVSQRSVLDLGCGSAVAGIAAILAGAHRCTINDIDPVALHIAGKNAQANKVSVFLEQKDLLATAVDIHFDVILVADMFYTRTGSQALLAFLHEQKKQGTTIFIADGGRSFAPKTDTGLLHEETLPVNHDLEGVDTRTVRIMQL